MSFPKAAEGAVAGASKCVCWWVALLLCEQTGRARERERVEKASPPPPPPAPMVHRRVCGACACVQRTQTEEAEEGGG